MKYFEWGEIEHIVLDGCIRTYFAGCYGNIDSNLIQKGVSLVSKSEI